MLLFPRLRRGLDDARFAGFPATTDKLNLLIGGSSLSVQLKSQAARTGLPELPMAYISPKLYPTQTMAPNTWLVPN